MEQNHAREEQNEENKNNPEGIIILGVYIHCEGCGNEVLRSLRGYQGVEEIDIDAKNNKVIVKGKKADPIKVAERLRKKSGKHVELISPQPKKEEKKVEKKPQPKVMEVVLKIYLHCESCAKDVKNCIHKMEGVGSVDPDMEKNLVTVKGTMDPQKLVEFITKRSGRHVEILKQITNETENDEHCCGHHNYPQQLLHVPQLFSDENPNSCSLM
ncbi:heavy metal-associated isoprenylated plant protein 26-like [Dorcoceras hygrometricum]|uniref:Heavy metal-associated isoprenylated plant protein 26-like n=1 Tax=Dorcoceras hygrometricum TaxID=472368 RepID=A0A2Z7A8G2_9LAMI|nr:heavy metal-associated isoprenylated plant protein 26-like [Dorcoceras hygrometricum]